MSTIAPSDLTQREPVNLIERVDSGETDESPFGSNLVTPEDEDSYLSRGIHERLDAAKEALGYFASKDVRSEIHEIPVILQPSETEASVSPGTPQVPRLLVDGHVDLLHRKDTEMFPMSDSEESIFSSTFEGICASPRTGSIYTLPNDHISIEAPPIAPNTPAPDFKASCDVQDTARGKKPAPAFWIVERQTFSLETVEYLIKNISPSALVSLVIKVLFFIPWCISVGGALLLAPDHLEYTAFGSGYLGLPPSGIQRFSHWANYGLQHVTIFIAFLAIIVYLFPSGGFVLLGGLVAQFCWEWHSFLFDHTKPLGCDDRQTVYLLATTVWLNGDAPEITKRGEDYYSLP